jgi:hypothetical protein
MGKDMVLVEMQTNEETDNAVSSLDGAVHTMVTALNTGTVRPAAGELIINTSGIARDVSGLVRDASGLVRDLSGAVKDDGIIHRYKRIAQMIQDLCRETERFSLYCRTFTDLATREHPDDIMKDTLTLIEQVCGMVRNASQITEEILTVPGNSKELRSFTEKLQCIRKNVTELEKHVQFVADTTETSSLIIHASGLVRDISGVARDLSGVIRGNGWR